MTYFVTGATGFIGRHLVAELLKREGTIHVLVREGSRGKLDALIQRLGAEDGRIVPVTGDLSKPGLGVEGFDEKVDHLFHLAAVYDVEADEESSERANVEGTKHVVEFANAHDIGRFHHTSSIAVAGNYDGVFQEDMFDEGQKLPHHYHRTKYESERLVREGVEAKTLVFRPGIVVGHSETGEMDKVDGPYYFFKLLQKLRHALPEWFPLAGPEGGQTNIVPVDFVARAMDHIAHLPDDDIHGDTFHLVNPEPMSVGGALNEFAKAAHAPQFAMRVDQNLTNVVPKQVRAGLKALPTVKKIRNQLYHDLGIPPAAMENRDFRAKFDARDAQRALSGTGIAVPPLSSYAPRLWDYWERNLDPDLFRERSLSSSVNGKRVLITGASSGIGLETALKVGEAGGEVILVSRTREKLEEVASQVQELGGTAHVHPADLADLEDIDRLAQEVLEEHGGVDILVNNAGRSIRRSVERSYDRFHDFERTMQLNYFGALKLILAFLPGMRERKSGHIVNVSSIGVQTNTPRFSAYVASKSALDAFSRCTAPEVVEDNVKFTTVYMPLVRTPMIEPTDIYKAFPTLTPEEAAKMLTDAMIDKPKRMASRLGTFGEVLYAVSPKTVDLVLNQAYNLFPDSTAAAKGKKKDRDAKDGDGRDGEKPKALPADQKKDDSEMSTEAVAMAYLLRGVHF
ncbi:MAG TPA: SDR family oxidoreductase [Thermoleophilaceae bacterium]|nr:SDR family oxidoreductase [Thermoleophilaceae bacterium]